MTEEVLIAAAPETVFGFFVDPALMQTWMGDHAILEPEAGGTFQVDIGPNRARGSYIEVIAPERVVFTWGWEGSAAVPPGSSTVTFTFEPDGEGTLLRMVHEGLSVEESSRHRHGWVHYLSRLAVAATGNDPGPDPHVVSGGEMHESQS
ncbi:MAG TPA: SRPBCC family protein [Acidimicrobiia bacterium]|nr:SRPBCC family protein [Acidimicrobiia bacterium]